MKRTRAHPYARHLAACNTVNTRTEKFSSGPTNLFTPSRRSILASSVKSSGHAICNRRETGGENDQIFESRALLTKEERRKEQIYVNTTGFKRPIFISNTYMIISCYTTRNIISTLLLI